MRLRAARLHRRLIIFTASVPPGVHRLRISDVSGLVAVEGVAIRDRRA